MESVTVVDQSCIDLDSILDMGCFVKLTEFNVGYRCFTNIPELKMSGLPLLQKFTCGEYSFIHCSRFVFESDFVCMD